MAGQPWQLLEVPRYAPVQLEKFPAQLELPEVLAQARAPEAATQPNEEVFGDIFRDPAQCAAIAFPYSEGETLEKTLVDGSIQVILNGLQDIPATATMREQPHRLRLGPHEGIGARFTYPNGLTLDTKIALLVPGVVRVDCLVWPASKGYQDAATHAASSLRVRLSE